MRLRGALCPLPLSYYATVDQPKTTSRRTVERERKTGGWKSWSEARGDALDRLLEDERYVALGATRHKEDR